MTKATKIKNGKGPDRPIPYVAFGPTIPRQVAPQQSLLSFRRTLKYMKCIDKIKD